MIDKRLVNRILSKPTYYTSDSVVEMVENAYYGEETCWIPVKGDETNEGSVEITDSVIQAITELLSNSIDAYVEPYVNEYSSRSTLLENEYEDSRIHLRFSGEKNGDFSFTVADKACGVSNEEFEDAFLRNPSQGGINKKNYDLLNGQFAQGSLASIGISEYGCKLIVSASENNPEEFRYTVTRYNEEERRYEYFVVNGEIPSFSGSIRLDGYGKVSSGTITKVFNPEKENTPKDFTTSPFIRNLGQKVPELPITLNIVDNRNGNGYNRIQWDGMTPELGDERAVRHAQTIVETPIGDVTVDAFYANENQELGYEFATANSDRIFYTVNGISHGSDSQSTLETKCNLKSMSDNILFFVDCSNLGSRLNEIFMPTRDRMKRNNKNAQKVRNSVYEAISCWDTIQSEDKKRTTIDDIADGESPLSEVSIDGQVENQKTGEFCVNLVVSSEYPQYAEHKNTNISVYGADEYNVELSGNSVSLTGIAKDENLMVSVNDSEYDKSVSTEFTVQNTKMEHRVYGLQRECESNVSVECGCTKTIKFSADYSHLDYWLSDNLDVRVQSINNSQVDTKSVNRHKGGLTVELEPKFGDNETVPVEVTVSDSSTSQKETVIIQQSQETTDHTGSLEQLVEKYSDETRISGLLDSMSEKERTVVADMTRSEIESAFEIDTSQKSTEQKVEREQCVNDTLPKLLDEDDVYICRQLSDHYDVNIERNTKVPFVDGSPAVHNIVNALLESYNFESFSKGQFKRIAGGRSVSANRIKNYGENVDDYTYTEDIIEFCRRMKKNSVSVSKDTVQNEINTAQGLVNNNNLHTGNRTKMATIQRTARGFIAERAVKKHGKNHGLELELDRDEYQSRTNTDGGVDIKSVNGSESERKIQIKAIQWYLLVDVTEFFQKNADTYVGYKVHIPDEKEFIAGETSVRVVPHGWADEDEMKLQPKNVSGEKYNINFSRDHNMSLPRCELNDMEQLFEDIL